MRSQLDSAQETTLQMRTECNDLRMEMHRAVPAHAAAVKVCHTYELAHTFLAKPGEVHAFVHSHAGALAVLSWLPVQFMELWCTAKHMGQNV